jgi:hypothetical protein
VRGMTAWCGGNSWLSCPASWSSVTGHQSQQILVSLNEVDPCSHMEAGMILPSFGGESVWTRQHNRELEELHERQES